MIPLKYLTIKIHCFSKTAARLNMTNLNWTEINGHVKVTTGNVSEGQIAREKNDVNHSTVKPGKGVVDNAGPVSNSFENVHFTSHISNIEKENQEVQVGQNLLTPGRINNSNPLDVTNPLAVYPTFAPRFPFTKETVTTREPSNTTTRNVAELELELLDVTGWPSPIQTQHMKSRC